MAEQLFIVQNCGRSENPADFKLALRLIFKFSPFGKEIKDKIFPDIADRVI